MPLTFPAHQSVVLPLKRYFPTRIDGLALVVGAGAPDVAFGVGMSWLFAHNPVSLMVIVPAVVAYCTALRRWALPGLFRYIPAVPCADLRVYGAMAVGSPTLVTSTVSATIGAASHQAWDSLSHAGHPVAAALGLDQFLFVAAFGPVSINVTPARLVQYSGHTLGSLAAVAMLYLWARQRPPELLDWAEADRLTAEGRPQLIPVLAILIPMTVIGFIMWPLVFGGRGPFVIIVAWAVAMVAVGRWIERRPAALRTRETEATDNAG